MTENARARQNRREFERYVGRVFAPYARFQRNRDTGAYRSTSVGAAWGTWGTAQHCPFRPLVDAFGEPIDKSQRRGKPLLYSRLLTMAGIAERGGLKNLAAGIREAASDVSALHWQLAKQKSKGTSRRKRRP